MKVDVVMCTWNSNQPWFCECLKSIKREIPVNHFILVDRFSTDGTREMVRSLFPNCKIILTKANLAKARKIGIQYVNTKYFVFVDDDVRLPRGWFNQVVSQFNSNIGAAHKQAFPVGDSPYLKWVYWKAERAAKLNKIVDLTSLQDCVKFRGYLHNTVIKTQAVKDWKPPSKVCGYEDHLLSKHIVSKGLTWRIIVQYDVKHYNIRNLKDVLRKSKWNAAGARLVRFGNYTLGFIIWDLIKRSCEALMISFHFREPRILPSVILERASFLLGYLNWSRYVLLERDDMTIKSKFERYLERRIKIDWLSDARQQNRLMILKKFISNASGLVLDCGCGEIEPKIICDSPNAVALDLASAGLANLKMLNFAGQVILASCTHLPLRGGAFEKAVCSEVIEHLPTYLDVKKCIQELERVSQIFMVTTPNNKFDFRWLEHTHKRYFNKENIRKYLPNNARIMESDVPQFKAPSLPLLPYFLLDKQHTLIGRYIAWFDNKLRKVPLCKLIAAFKTRPVGGAFIIAIVESRKKVN